MQDGEDRRAFLRRELAPEYNEQNSSWLTGYNDDGVHDWRDLTVQEEEIYRIDNTTGSGHANRTQFFYRGFSDEVSEVAGALLSRADEVFVGVAPDLWRTRDTRGDSIGDRAEALSHGYGVHIGLSEHGMSGLTMGPDGRIY